MIKSILQKIAADLGYVVRKRKSGLRRAASAQNQPVDQAWLMQNIHGKNIYSGFDTAKFPSDPSGWGSDSPAFAKIFAEFKPRFVIEVGTWKGGSALTMAKLLRACSGGTILCIDTWLGAIEFWENQNDPSRFQSLNCHHGFPQVYYTFLANVCHANAQDIIVPFPLNSSSAALWLMRQGIQADAIYIDASHEEDDVYQDLLDYSQVLKKGSILFGDDWLWLGVQNAVRRFAKEERLRITHIDDKWVLQTC
jgi:hypothetical protein